MRWSEPIFKPVAVPADEPIVVFRRGSLLAHAPFWLLLLLWAVLIFASDVGLLAFRAAQEAAAVPLNALFILLAVFLLPAVWLGLGRLNAFYLVSDQTLYSPGRPFQIRIGEYRRESDLLEIPLRSIATVRVATRRSRARVRSTEVEVWLPRQPGPVVLEQVASPERVAAELRQRVRAARAMPDRRQAASLLPKDASPIPRRRTDTAIRIIIVGWLLLLAGWMLLRVITLAFAASGSLQLQLLPLLSGLLALTAFFISFARWWYDVYVVTEHRVIHRQGIMVQRRQVLSLSNIVSATELVRGLGKFVDVGDVQLVTAGRTGKVSMHNIDGPRQVRKIVLDTQERLHRQHEQGQIGNMEKQLESALYME